MLNKYFAGCTTLEELKAEYKKLVMMHHPDRGGDLATMQEINAEYDHLFPQLKNKHKNKDGEAYEKESEEAPNELKDLMDKLMRMDGVHIEIIGCFVWASGDTKPHKDQLKAMGFKWHSKKMCWYKAPADYKRRGKKQYGMDEIRSMYGVRYEADGEAKEKRLAG